MVIYLQLSNGSHKGVELSMCFANYCHLQISSAKLDFRVTGFCHLKMNSSHSS